MSVEAARSNRFDGKVALITGAASGVGAATAWRFSQEGAQVILVDIADEQGYALSESIGNAATFAHCDVGEAADWSALADTVRTCFGRLDVIHNNAFSAHRQPAHELGEKEWDRQLAVILKALYLSAATFIEELKTSRGVIITTSSVHALVGLPDHPAYAAAKGGIGALVRQLAVEYGPDVRVNAVLPGPIHTRIWSNLDDKDRMLAAEATVAGRLGEPEEVANAICFLASEEASFITGASLTVDGGWSIAKKSP